MSRNTSTATSAVLSAVWAPSATDPLSQAATPSPSASTAATTSERTTPLRVLEALAPSVIRRRPRLDVVVPSTVRPPKWSRGSLEGKGGRRFGVARASTRHPR